LKTDDFSKKLSGLIARRLAVPRTRQFGFEYEFMPHRIMNPGDLLKVQEILVEGFGYSLEPGLFRTGDHYVTFEPGGQIEFCSIPMDPGDMGTALSVIHRAGDVMETVKRRIGLEYLPIGFMPGRASAPMLLDKPRYHNLHRLLGVTGTRGREMMKGTAAIHLHVGLLSLEELPGLWKTVCEMSRLPEFRMGPERRNIWDNTDPSRCGLLCRGEMIPYTDYTGFINRIRDFGLEALDLATGKPFKELQGVTFQGFLDHLTTLFTDVRINMKGVTLELRTLDSAPPQLFLERWQQFLNLVQQGVSAMQSTQGLPAEGSME
jgi:glutamate--cysteine ligase